MGKKMFDKEEYELVKQFTNETQSSTSTGLYLFEGGATALLPVYVFLFIQHVDLESSILTLGVFTVLAAYVLSKTYEKVAIEYKGDFEKAISATVKQAVNEQTKDKDVSKDKKNEAVRKLTSNAAEDQASALSILYINAVFLAVFIFTTFFLFKNFSLQMNFAFSMTVASAIPFMISS